MRREGFARTKQGFGDRNDRHRFCRHVARCAQRMSRCIAHPVIRPGDVAQCHVGRRVPGLPGQQRFEYVAGNPRFPGAHRAIPVSPVPIRTCALRHSSSTDWLVMRSHNDGRRAQASGNCHPSTSTAAEHTGSAPRLRSAALASNGNGEPTHPQHEVQST